MDTEIAQAANRLRRIVKEVPGFTGDAKVQIQTIEPLRALEICVEGIGRVAYWSELPFGGGLHEFRPGAWVDYLIKLCEEEKERRWQENAKRFTPVDDTHIFGATHGV